MCQTTRKYALRWANKITYVGMRIDPSEVGIWAAQQWYTADEASDYANDYGIRDTTTIMRMQIVAEEMK